MVLSLKGAESVRPTGFLARDRIMQSALLYAIARPSVCPSVRHTGGSVKNGWS